MRISKQIATLLMASIALCCCSKLDGREETVAATQASLTTYPTIGAALIVGNIEATAGEYVTLPIRIQYNPGVTGAMFSVYFDENALELIEATAGEAFSSLEFSASAKLGNICNFLFDAADVSEEDIKDGTILDLVFRVNEKASAGRYPVDISFRPGDIIDRDLNELQLSIINGSIVIK